jgi:hypothetical protein
VNTLVLKPESLATSTEYVAVADPARVALAIVSVMGCDANAIDAPLAGVLACGAPKLVLADVGDLEQAAAGTRQSVARMETAIRRFMNPPERVAAIGSPSFWTYRASWERAIEA